MERLSRRQILQLLGASAVAVSCGAPSEGDPESSASAAELADEAAAITGRRMLDGIDNFVVVMQENRSFDHFLGALQRDKNYVNRNTVNGTSGHEWNPAPERAGKVDHVEIYDAKTYKLESPPHEWGPAHDQYNDGKNDGFVIAAAGDKNGPKYEAQTMAYYDRSQIPFYYSLAEKYTLFDKWHASVMGPTIPNRLYLNCGTSENSKDNAVLRGKDAPNDTIWDHLRAKKISAKSYYAGRAGMMASRLPDKTIPFEKIHQYFLDAKNGTLPSVSFVEPDYSATDDHPAHDIRLGQAFVSSIYHALARSPQWSKSLLIVIYDEHGGFYDHVPPPEAKDHYPDFRRYGFRVPAFVAGPTVKQGHLAPGLHDHTSVLATLALRFGLPDLSVRAANAAALTKIFDADLFKKPSAPAIFAPVELDAEALESVGVSSQTELEEDIDNDVIPPELTDARPLAKRVEEWLQDALSVGAVKLVS